jgi:hypothetical protein
LLLLLLLLLLGKSASPTFRVLRLNFYAAVTHEKSSILSSFYVLTFTNSPSCSVHQLMSRPCLSSRELFMSYWCLNRTVFIATSSIMCIVILRFCFIRVILSKLHLLPLDAQLSQTEIRTLGVAVQFWLSFCTY